MWKDIIQYKNMYQVSIDGAVRSLGRMRYGKWCVYNKPLILKPTDNGNGYNVVSLCKNGKRKTRPIHRLVAETFVYRCDTSLEVNHKDGDKGNNNVTNLEWVSHSENLKHAHRIGIKKPPMLGRIGVLNPNSKPVYMYDINMNFIKMFLSASDVYRDMGLNLASVSMVCTGKRKTCGGYVFKHHYVSDKN